MKYDVRLSALLPVRLFNFEEGAVGAGAGFVSGEIYQYAFV